MSRTLDSNPDNCTEGSDLDIPAPGGIWSEFDLHRLLFTKRQTMTTYEPFFYGCVDDYFPPKLYAHLLETFPREPIQINYQSSFTLDKRNSFFQEFQRNSPIWSQTLGFFTSDLFLNDLQKFIAPEVIKNRGGHPQKKWHYTNDWSIAPPSKDVTPIKVTFKFSEHTNGSWIPPHTDQPCKLFSIILYFPDERWQKHHGGGTQVYEPKHWTLKRNWHGVYAPFELMTCRDTLTFVPNRLVFLLKTKESWHGMPPLTCPESLSRRALLISLHDDVYQTSETKQRICKWMTRTLIQALNRFHTHSFPSEGDSTAGPM